MTPSPVAVCSWSLSPTNPAELISRMGNCELDAVQLALGPVVRSITWQDAGNQLAAAGIRLVSGMVGCVGEDYSSIESIRRTGGVMPDDTWPMTLEHMQAAAPIARALGLALVTFHAGFIPDDPRSSAFEKGLQRIHQVADVFAAQGCAIALETGQESAEALLAFLHRIDRADVGVNFDPANMLLYGSGEPIAALSKLLPRIRQVHIKDAIASGVPGQWGREVPVGLGQVDWTSFFGVLNNGRYVGNYVIEREAGADRHTDVKNAAALIRRFVPQTCSA